MKKTYGETCLIELKVGDRVKRIGDGRVGVLKDIKLVPNTRHDVANRFGLVAILYVKMDSGSVQCATSDKFLPLVDEPYDEFYPTAHLEKIE